MATTQAVFKDSTDDAAEVVAGQIYNAIDVVSVQIPNTAGPWLDIDGVEYPQNSLQIVTKPAGGVIAAADPITVAEFALVRGGQGAKSSTELEIVRYTVDGAIQDKDHRAIFETGAVNMTLAASTTDRLIQMVSEGPTTVITANGAEEFTSGTGTSTDQKLTINETFKWATIIGRTAAGWSQYVGQVGLPEGVESQQQIGDALIEDRGIFREIHGRFSGTGSGTHVFPDGGFGAGFDPIVSGTSMNNGNNIDVGSTSPTQFTYRQWDVESSQQAGDIMYVAKGLKP